MPLAPNTGYGMLNSGTALPGGNPGGLAPNAGYQMLNPTKLPPRAINAGRNLINPTGASPGGEQIIPDAGVYGAETAAANEAYQTAITNALASRNALYGQYGLLNNGQVDPNNPYGQYQQLLSQEGSQLSADEENSAGRNLGRGGLANQQASSDKAQQAFQNFAFQNQVSGNETNYRQALASALDSKNSATSQAYNDALNTALQNMILNMQNGYYTSGNGNDNSNNNNPHLDSGTPTPPKSKTTPPPKKTGSNGGRPNTPS